MMYFHKTLLYRKVSPIGYSIGYRVWPKLLFRLVCFSLCSEEFAKHLWGFCSIYIYIQCICGNYALVSRYSRVKPNLLFCLDCLFLTEFYINNFIIFFCLNNSEEELDKLFCFLAHKLYLEEEVLYRKFINLSVTALVQDFTEPFVSYFCLLLLNFRL